MRCSSPERFALVALSLMVAARLSSAAVPDPTPRVGQLARYAIVVDVASTMDAAATSFTDVGAGLQGVYNSSVAWGDYDNDGDLDFLLTGFTGAASLTGLYRNSGGANPTFSDVGAGLTGVQSSSVAWGDYDNDGDLDILVTGFNTAAGPVTKLYRNDGGATPTFTDVGASLTNVQSSSVAWGDYDNDGDLDILLTGTDAGFVATTRLYRSSGGANPTFSNVGAALDNVQQSSVAWGDYDKDGDLDILLTGLIPGVGSISKLYRNSGGANPTFSDVGAGLTGVSLSSVAWGDYDNDGDLDILLAGFVSAAAGRTAKVYRNSGGANPTFSDVGAGLDAVSAPSVAWGDYDNDGDLDFLLSGFTGVTRITKLYQSSGGANPTFSDASAGLPAVQSPSVVWGDYDNDADLDILLTGYDIGNVPISRLYRSDGAVPNTRPTAPGSLNATTGASSTTFSWNAASDAQTPAPGLTYNLRVGTTPGGNEVSSSMAAGDGYRRVVRLGSANHDLSWRLRLPTGTYYWSVQALDGAFAGSAFAVERSFSVTSFTQISLPGITECAADWGDYDNDGDLDIVVAGLEAAGPVSKIYRNDGGGAFVDIGAGLTGARFSAAAWGDFDNDADLDLAIAGASLLVSELRTKLYRNDGNGVFTDIAAGLPGVAECALTWGDYDNDGDLDLVLAGFDASNNPISRLFRNDGSGVFSDAAAGLAGVGYSSVAWGDYDNDGDLDLLLAGSNAADWVTKLYRNNGDGSFTDVPTALPGVSEGFLAWGDHDGDGDLDVLLSGDTPQGLASKVFRNDGSSVFTDVGAGLFPVTFSSGAWGDYDNDGDLDIALQGYAGFVYGAIYRNDGNGVFTDILVSLNWQPFGSIAWGDYDNDRDLDLLLAGASSALYVCRIDGFPNNAPPAPPGNLSAVRSGGLVTFSWAAASDDHTPASGLHYNLRVGTSPGGDQWMPAMAASNGYRRVARPGNAQERTSWTLTLPPGPYEWSVQAIDGAFQGSSFSGGPTVAVEDAAETPATFDLGPAAPNPFTAEVAMSFALPRSGPVEIAVFDLAGRRLRVLERGPHPAGRHRVIWDGRDEAGARLGNGVYLVRMNAAQHVGTRKVVLAR